MCRNSKLTTLIFLQTPHLHFYSTTTTITQGSNTIDLLYSSNQMDSSIVQMDSSIVQMESSIVQMDSSIVQMDSSIVQMDSSI